MQQPIQKRRNEETENLTSKMFPEDLLQKNPTYFSKKTEDPRQIIENHLKWFLILGHTGKNRWTGKPIRGFAPN